MSLKPKKLKNRIMIGAFVLGKAQKYKLPWRLLIVSFGAGCVLLALEIIWFRFLRLIGLTREDYPEYHDYLSITFSKVKQKPRVVEEHDSMAGILSSVEAGTGVAIGADIFGYSFGNRLKRVRLIPEPKPISIGIIAPKGRLSPAAEKFWQCAKEAASGK
jgi:DNA-binding transcriptional LysR family regulator